jgi:hypothetical protein
MLTACTFREILLTACTFREILHVKVGKFSRNFEFLNHVVKAVKAIKSKKITVYGAAKKIFIF